MKKSELRLLIKAERQALSPNEAEKKSLAICKNVLSSELYKNAESVALYMPIKNEVAVGTIAKKAFDDGKKVCVPITDGDTIYLSEIFADDKFIPGKFGIREPQEKRKIKSVDVIFVPGLAFSESGERLGWGGGYYDRLLATLDSVKIGIGYDFQIRADIEVLEHDRKMDYVVSESGLIACE